MALKVHCACGTTYKVSEDAAGKRIKCRTCGKVLFVPEPPTEEHPLSQEGACPHCGEVLRPGTIFCTGCGYNLETGALHKPPTPAPLPRAATRRAVVLPWRRIIGAGVLLGIVAAAWFGLIRPMRARSAIDAAMVPAEKAKYNATLEMLQAARGKTYGRYAEEVEFRIAQMELEKKFQLSGGPSEAGQSIGLEAIPQIADNGKLLLNVALTNTSNERIVLRQRDFYLASNLGLVEAANYGEGSIEGVVVAPGGTGKGLVAFWRLPGSPMGLITAEIVKPQRLVYNDGVRYRSTLFILTGAGRSPIEANVPLP